MSFNDQFELLLRARYPLIYIPTPEEERVETAIALSAKRLGDRAVYIWDFVDGYQGNPNDAGFGRRNPLQALEFIEKLPESAAAIFVLRDFHRFFGRCLSSAETKKFGTQTEISAEKFGDYYATNRYSG